MSYTYSTWLTAASDAIVVQQTDPNFTNIVPSCIDYAEQRLYRELDLLDTVVRDSSGTLTVGTRNFTLPTSLGRFVVTNGINVITPAGVTDPDVGTRIQLVPTSRDFLDMAWPSTTGAATPSSYAMVTDQQIIVGPAPNAAYTVEVIGTIRPTPLSASNPTTYLTQYLPDLWFAATMVFLTGYQQNFGAQSDNPQMAVSWSATYDKLIASANIEEQRKRYASGAWGSLSPTPIATPSR
jgi:hypothetical protein